MPSDEPVPLPRHPIIAIVKPFLAGPLSLLVIVIALLAGIIAIVATPREEEPQIVVPVADVYVDFPGHSAAEVEQLVTTRLERLLWQVEDVEHVYSVSRRDQAMVTVRFFVGTDRDRAMVKLRDRIDGNLDLVPPGVTGWLVKPVEIDDVPIVSLTLYSDAVDGHGLRRVAEEMRARLESIRNISRTEILGGYPREVRVEPDPEAMTARGVMFADITAALARANHVWRAGEITDDNRNTGVLVGPGLATVEAVARTVVTERAGRTVRIEDVATVADTHEEPESYVHLGFGPAGLRGKPGQRYTAVTMAFSKKRGTNAVAVAKDIIRAAEELRPQLVGADIDMLVTRDYGKTANEKVNGLLQNMFFAVLTVVGVIALTMGWREGLVVGLAVPVSFALALFTNFAFGFTINRVTLFALILSLGLVVDDPITNVDNIQRHIRMGKDKPFTATLRAVHEVSPAVIMSTLAIIASFLPMFFITGMMGPYMGPMAINVPLTVSFSTVCALTFVPWLSLTLLRGRAPGAGGTAAQTEPVNTTPAWVRKGYRLLISPFLKPRNAILMLVGVVALLGLSCLLAVYRKVPLKMLPFDNKDELQLVVEMPEGTATEATERLVRDLEKVLETVAEVRNFQSYTGINSPIDFNGMVRHYGMRREAHQADIRINLAERSRRKSSSHDLALRIRDDITEIARRHGALVKIVEMPPGPPVLAGITVEIRGSHSQRYEDLLDASKQLMQTMHDDDPRHITEVDDSSEAPHERLRFTIDRDKAAAHGLAVGDIAAFLKAGIEGTVPGVVHAEHERNPLLIRVRLPRGDRYAEGKLGALTIATAGGPVPLAELGFFSREPEEQPIYHKNMEPVVFVYAEPVGRPPGGVIFDLYRRLKKEPLPPGIRDAWAGEGEWEITVRVFRDLGIAFGVAMIGIYLLLTVQMRSFTMPLLVLTAIPLTAIGIMPGFYLLNLVTGKTVGGYPSPVYFTATAMIGMIALGGIVIRNSLVLIEFIQDSLKAGRDVREAILESGAVRFRPIMLTALTTMLGAWPITLDPIFSGLAWALIFGLVASTFFTLIVVPAVYMLVGPRVIAPGHAEA